ncbi:unnamed protein product [Cercopithifilaria johnstoni]|uniref:Uncharacterized protein n=1 Tax=Cercopithifilaria johnstoni TaxID=2874296 RepID=A0A8J2MSX1_9BILA|nr:unnamed protein product [Cercopithifilaria johnstoni]
MVWFVNVLVILVTIHATSSFVHLDGIHQYDKYHLHEMQKLLQHTLHAMQHKLRMIFQNNTLTKQELNDAIRKWIKDGSSALESTIVDNLRQHQQQIIEMQKSIEESTNISPNEQKAALMILKIKANMSLTNSQEINEIDQFMKSLNRTDRIKIRILLHQISSKHKLNPRSIQIWDELLYDYSDDYYSDEILNDYEPSSYVSCCDSENPCDVISVNLNMTMKDELTGVMKNCMNQGNSQIPDGVIEQFLANITQYARSFDKL